MRKGVRRTLTALHDTHVRASFLVQSIARTSSCPSHYIQVPARNHWQDYLSKSYTLTQQETWKREQSPVHGLKNPLGILQKLETARFFTARPYKRRPWSRVSPLCPQNRPGNVVNRLRARPSLTPGARVPRVCHRLPHVSGIREDAALVKLKLQRSRWLLRSCPSLTLNTNGLNSTASPSHPTPHPPHAPEVSPGLHREGAPQRGTSRKESNLLWSHLAVNSEWTKCSASVSPQIPLHLITFPKLHLLFKSSFLPLYFYFLQPQRGTVWGITAILLKHCPGNKSPRWVWWQEGKESGTP